jgi:hypothetical protein
MRAYRESLMPLSLAIAWAISSAIILAWQLGFLPN